MLFFRNFWGKAKALLQHSFRQKARARFHRFVINSWPCIRGGGGRVTQLSPDYTRLTVRLKLGWRTRNVVGTIYGGSMYASTDPFYMLMLRELLGSDFIVWDKGCVIRFVRPAKQTIWAEFHITPEMLTEVRTQVALHQEASFTWKIQFKDKTGVVYSEFDKTLYVAEKPFYKEKLVKRQTRAKA